MMARSTAAQIGAKPTPASADRWVADRAPAVPDKRALYTARLTIDVLPAMRSRIKLAAFAQGQTVADMLRAILDERFPDPAGSDGDAR
jgi:hypothetical protein